MEEYKGQWIEVKSLDIINRCEGIRGNPSFGLEEYRLWAYEWIEAVRIKEEEKVTIDKKGIKDLIELARSFEEGICEVLIKRNIKETASSPRLASGMKDLEGTWIKASYSQVTSIRGEGWFWDFSWIEDVRISGSDRSIEFIKEKIKIILKAGECEVLIREHCENSSVGFSPEMREYRGKWIRIFGLDIGPSSGTEIVRNIGINGSRSWLWDLRWIEDARIYGRSLRKRFYKEMEFEEELVTTDPLLGKLKSISMLSSEEEL